MTDTQPGLVDPRIASALTRTTPNPRLRFTRWPEPHDPVAARASPPVHIVDSPGVGLKARTAADAVELRSSLDPDAHRVMPATARPGQEQPPNALDTAPLLQG